MGNKINIEKAAEQMSDEWLGKNGVSAIWVEKKKSQLYLKVLVENLPRYKDKLPDTYQGYTVKYENTPQIEMHT